MSVCRVQQLRSDIENVKVAKVQLLKKMRAESDRFREWRSEKNREVRSRVWV